MLETKSNFFAKIALVSIFAMLTGCSDDDEKKVETQADLIEQTKMSSDVDAVADDIMTIIESEYSSQSTAGRSPQETQDFLPECVTITSTTTGGNWESVIDFGTTGCTMPNGNVLKGIITVTGTTDFTAMSQTINYGFNGFYHNNKLVEGDKYVVRVLENSNGNPQASIELDLSVTFPDGEVVTREGNRVWEWIEGMDTILNPLDNVYLVTGEWITYFPDNSLSTEIDSALRIEMTCPYIVEGTVNFSTNSNGLVLDYGDGTCNNEATVSINGADAIIIYLD